MKLCNTGTWNTVETRLKTEKSNARCSSASSASSENSIAMKSSPTRSSLSKMRLCFSLVPAISPSKHITLLPAMLHVCYLYIPRTSPSRYLQWFPVSLSTSLQIQRLFFTISMTYQRFFPPPGACAHMARRNVVWTDWASCSRSSSPHPWFHFHLHSSSILALRDAVCVFVCVFVCVCLHTHLDFPNT